MRLFTVLLLDEKFYRAGAAASRFFVGPYSPGKTLNMCLRRIAVRYLFAILLLCSSAVHAQSFVLPSQMLCMDRARFMQTITEDYKEEPVLLGRGGSEDPGSYGLFVNPDTKSWTMAAFRGDMACILAAGSNAVIKFGKSV